MSVTVSERRNVVLLLFLLGNIKKSITTLRSMNKVVFMAMKSGIPFKYDFNSIDESTLDCAELLSDLDFLVQRGFVIKDFRQIGTERIVAFQADIESAELKKYMKEVLGKAMSETLEKFARTIGRNPKPDVIDRIFENFRDK